jgi:hypothetical protein
VTPEEFDAFFDRFAVSAWRLEALQRYAIDEEDERIRAWREGLPRPERSVRTSPWLRRVAVSTAAGKQWGRVHVVDYPLSEYVRYLIGGGSYAETSAAGEEIRIADRTAHPGLAGPGPDFWLFDENTADAGAILMSYDDAGHWLGAEYTTDPAAISRCCEIKALAMAASVPLSVYLARIGADAVRMIA